MSKKLDRSKRVTLKCEDPSLAVHSQAYETDINNMVKGLTPFTQSRRRMFYIDETILPLNYEAQYNAVIQAQDAFMELPPQVREMFKNDPALLAAALGDPSQVKRLVELGIMNPDKLPDPAKPSPGGSDEPPVKAGEKEGTK